MSNALAIAHVTQALALLIENNLRPEIDMAVSVETRKPPAEPPTEPTVNVFLYQVTPNPSMRNNDLATRASDGTLLKRAVAALDLHYVISAYGEETELVGQRLIGSVVRTLHEIPALPQDVIEAAAELPYLEGSDLAESPQRVRFIPQVMDVDETSKLWGMLYQTPYTLSVVYTGTLVLIDGRDQPVPAQAVERSSVRVLPFGPPGAPVPARAGDRSSGRSGAAGPDGGDRARTGTTPGAEPRARPRKTAQQPSVKEPEAAQPPASTTSRTTHKTTRKSAAKKTTAAKPPDTAQHTRGTSRAKGPKGPEDSKDSNDEQS